MYLPAIKCDFSLHKSVFNSIYLSYLGLVCFWGGVVVVVVCFMCVCMWHKRLTFFQLSGSREKRGWKERQTETEISNFSVISFSWPEWSCFMIFYVSIPVQLHALWSQYLYFIIESILSLGTINFLFVPYRLQIPNFLMNEGFYFCRIFKTPQRRKYPLAFKTNFVFFLILSDITVWLLFFLSLYSWRPQVNDI